LRMTIAKRLKEAHDNAAMLTTFNEVDMSSIISMRNEYKEEFQKRYSNADFYWCQEEPLNMGAWNTVKRYIDRTLEIINFNTKSVEYIGRRPSASTATGNLNKHLAQQKEILEKVVGKIN